MPVLCAGLESLLRGMLKSFKVLDSLELSASGDGFKAVTKNTAQDVVAEAHPSPTAHPGPTRAGSTEDAVDPIAGGEAGDCNDEGSPAARKHRRVDVSIAVTQQAAERFTVSADLDTLAMLLWGISDVRYFWLDPPPFRTCGIAKACYRILFVPARFSWIVLGGPRAERAC